MIEKACSALGSGGKRTSFDNGKFIRDKIFGLSIAFSLSFINLLGDASEDTPVSLIQISEKIVLEAASPTTWSYISRKRMARIFYGWSNQEATH